LRGAVRENNTAVTPDATPIPGRLMSVELLQRAIVIVRLKFGRWRPFSAATSNEWGRSVIRNRVNLLALCVQGGRATYERSIASFDSVPLPGAAWLFFNLASVLPARERRGTSLLKIDLYQEDIMSYFKWMKSFRSQYQGRRRA